MVTENSPAVQNPDVAHDAPRQGPLYEARKKIHPRLIKGGRYRQIKSILLWVFLAVYHFSPWIRWDRGPGQPDQAILLDLEGRRGYFFMIEIWPQEVYYLTGILILAAIGLFFAASLFGRVWCGFACFQTVWTDLFMKVEEWIEGDRSKRIRLDKAPMSAGKFFKRVAKHVVWLLISAIFALSFVWYFNDAPTVTADIIRGDVGGWLLVTLLTLIAMTYLLAGMAREQVCFYMCPYGRFQSAMFDEDSLIVTYEAWRGEPRKHPGKSRDFGETSHCVDCTMCVQVCPTGIDIRDGQQMECIGCALCIDACNEVMDKFGLPRDLITWDSIRNQKAREQGHKGRMVKLIRPRTLVYVGILMAVMTVMAVSLFTRERLEINIQRDRAPLFVTLSDGSIRNGYTYKILNMQSVPKTYELSVAGIDGNLINVIGQDDKKEQVVTLEVPGDKVGTFRVFVRADRDILDAPSTDIDFVLKDLATGETYNQHSVFRGP